MQCLATSHSMTSVLLTTKIGTSCDQGCQDVNSVLRISKHGVTWGWCGMKLKIYASLSFSLLYGPLGGSCHSTLMTSTRRDVLSSGSPKQLQLYRLCNSYYIFSSSPKHQNLVTLSRFKNSNKTFKSSVICFHFATYKNYI